MRNHLNLPTGEGPNDIAKNKRMCDFFQTETDRIILDLSEEYAL